MGSAGVAQAVSARFHDLAGKAAIITGASRGIGRGIAKFLAGQGMRLVLAGIDGQEGEPVADAFRAAGADCTWITADLAESCGAKLVFDESVRRYGSIHLLVNNAAQLHSAPFLELDEDTYRVSMEANLRIAYHLSRHVARHMAEAKSGCIVNISSVGGTRAHHHLAGYDAYKGALDAMTRSMAVNLAPHGVRVNAIAPGAILTRVDEPRHMESAKKRAQYIPLQRLGTTLDIAAAVAFLASDAAAYITGQILYVDGGLTTQLTPPGIFA